MTEKEAKTNQINVSLGTEYQTTFWAGDEWLDTVDEFVEESPFSTRAAAIRSLVILGMREYVLSDPRRSAGEEQPNDEMDYSPTTIREIIPEGEENAVSLKNELPELIDEQLLEIVENDPNIKRNGWKVYR